MSTIKVEVCYASVHEQKLISLNVLSGSSVIEVIEQSKIKNLFPEINLEKNKVGIFGKVLRSPEMCQLRSGDRIEIYRPLIKKQVK
jgi:putative ubiquitin-RnfH superfamily antitoxin RatB of RatAB toxin-antitoxin module